MSLLKENDSFDYHQEVARSAFADMLHDTERNDKYSVALREAIQTMQKRGRRANVVDIGTGTGLLAMLAAQHGADSVVTIEAFSPVSHVARKIIEINGFKNMIKIINKHSTEVKVGPGLDMEQKANILVAEVLDTELIGEGAIRTYNHAHRNLMEKDCICVPDSASIFVQVIDSPTVTAWNTLNPLPLRDKSDLKCPENVANCFGSDAIHDLQLSQLPLSSFKSMTGPIKLCDVDFSGKADIMSIEKFSRKFTAIADGEANGIFFWWDLKMNPSGSETLSCAPHWNHPLTDASESERVRQNSIPWRDHWMQGCFYLKSRLKMKEGRSAVITAQHDEFSWWFELSYDEDNNRKHIDVPTCSCLFHKVNSRNRIIQMNHRLKVFSQLKLVIDSKENSYVFLGDHNLVALTAGSLKESTMYLLQEDSFCFKSVENFIDANDDASSKIHLIRDFNEIETAVTHIIAEPYYNSAVLPWDHMTQLWNQLDRLRQKQSTEFKVLFPLKASIFAVPVRFLNLHKIRWPLKSTCGGFNHEVFDEIIEAASSLADENVEPFSLWEYPCVALNDPTNIYEMTFDDKSIKDDVGEIFVDKNGSDCNGIAFWVEWNIDDYTSCLSSGPSTKVEMGKQIDWSIHERQAVHLIPCRTQAEQVTKIDIKVQYNKDEQKLLMDFQYTKKLK